MLISQSNIVDHQSSNQLVESATNQMVVSSVQGNDSAENFFSRFPDELILQIFSNLDFATRSQICLVCHQWNRIANDRRLMKMMIFKELAFGINEWRNCLRIKGPDDFIDGEDFKSLSDNVIDGIKEFKIAFPDKKIKENLMLVRLPRTLVGEGFSVSNLGAAVMQFFANTATGYNAISEDLKTKAIDQPRWILMTKAILPESRGKSAEELKTIIASKGLKGFDVPETIEAAACILSQFLSSRAYLFSSDPNTFTYCKDGGIVGGFSEAGLRVLTYRSADDVVGVAAVLRLFATKTRSLSLKEWLDAQNGRANQVFYADVKRAVCLPRSQ